MEKVIFQKRRFSHPCEPQILELDLPSGEIFNISSDLDWIYLHFKTPVSEKIKKRKFHIVAGDTEINLSEKLRLISSVGNGYGNFYLLEEIE